MSGENHGPGNRAGLGHRPYVPSGDLTWSSARDRLEAEPAGLDLAGQPLYSLDPFEVVGRAEYGGST